MVRAHPWPPYKLVSSSGRTPDFGSGDAGSNPAVSSKFPLCILTHIILVLYSDDQTDIFKPKHISKRKEPDLAGALFLWVAVGNAYALVTGSLGAGVLRFPTTPSAVKAPEAAKPYAIPSTGPTPA